MEKRADHAALSGDEHAPCGAEGNDAWLDLALYYRSSIVVQLRFSSFFFFSSRRRHTRSDRDWVQTCALPISWPLPAHRFLAEILPHSQPLNFALLADKLERRFNFKRSRAAVPAYVRQQFPNRVPTLRPGPKPRRRWQCATIGELWQHDSSPHSWWPAEQYPTLILTLDDHSRKILGGTFVPSDTT